MTVNGKIISGMSDDAETAVVFAVERKGVRFLFWLDRQTDEIQAIQPMLPDMTEIVRAEAKSVLVKHAYMGDVVYTQKHGCRMAIPDPYSFKTMPATRKRAWGASLIKTGLYSSDFDFLPVSATARRTLDVIPAPVCQFVDVQAVTDSSPVPVKAVAQIAKTEPAPAVSRQKALPPIETKLMDAKETSAAKVSAGFEPVKPGTLTLANTLSEAEEWGRQLMAGASFSRSRTVTVVAHKSRNRR